MAQSREAEEGCTQQPSPLGVVPVRHSAEVKLREGELGMNSPNSLGMNWEVPWP